MGQCGADVAMGDDEENCHIWLRLGSRGQSVGKSRSLDRPSHLVVRGVLVRRDRETELEEKVLERKSTRSHSLEL